MNFLFIRAQKKLSTTLLKYNYKVLFNKDLMAKVDSHVGF